MSADADGLAVFNAAPADSVHRWLLAVCASPLWAGTVATERPFATPQALYDVAARALAVLPEPDLDQALAGHPRIGERSEHASSQREQAAVATADQEIRDRIAEGNAQYEARFGHVYLVRAAGRTPEELLRLLRTRLRHDPVTERRVVREQLAEINRLRLERLLCVELAGVRA